MKELSCELSSSFNIISDSEEASIFFQIAVMFEMENKNEGKRKYRVPEFFTNKKKKRPFNNLAMKLADRDSFLVRFSFF